MLKESGQSLIEILVALAIFVLVLCAVLAIVGSSFLNSQQTEETSLALWLAEEGLAASRSIHNNNWASLVTGSHGLTISSDHWIFAGSQEDISSQLNQGQRQITISDLAFEQKLISAKITWQFSPSRTNQVELFTVLTNWQKITGQPGACQGTCTRCKDLSPEECTGQQGCYLQQTGKKISCKGKCIDCDTFTNQPECEVQQGCQWIPE